MGSPSSLVVSSHDVGSKPSRRTTLWRLIAALLVSIALLATEQTKFDHKPPPADPICPQEQPRWSKRHEHLLRDLGAYYSSEEHILLAAGALGGAVRIPTETFDSFGAVGQDPRWDAFYPFHDYLQATFPRIYSTLNLTKVNTHGLLFTWDGSDASLKPLMLAAHQDVVPVEPSTIAQWTHPPWSGLYDGTMIWGRGSVDDKAGLIGILLSIESLLARGFQPRRTLVLAFGFDEESSSFQGAGELKKVLLERWGKDGIAMIVDEGDGLIDQYGAQFATPAVGEKGYIDVRIQVDTAGGHSSVPPAHTGIGILAALLVQLEKHPIPASLDRSTPLYQMIQCLGAWAPNLDPKLQKAIMASSTSDSALRVVEDILFQDVEMKSTAGTTQAIDLISGGIKINALPETANAVVNHRIATNANVESVKERYKKLLVKTAESFNMSLEVFSELQVKGGKGKIIVSDAWDSSLEPAPISPSSGDLAKAFKLLSSSILAVEKQPNVSSVIVAPSAMSGNTDTRHYWDLSRHIFRYTHLHEKDGINIHTVDEAINARAFSKLVQFFSTLILNADDGDL